jgi:predicted porin
LQDQTSLHIAYASGPLSVGAGMNKAKAEVEAAPPVTAINQTTIDATARFPSAAMPNVAVKSDLNWIGASYDLGVAKVMATHVTRKDKLTTPAPGGTYVDVKVNSIGVAVPMGSVTLGANTFRGKDNRGTGNTDDMKLSGYQLSATYALSKRTLIYAATGESKSQRNSAANTAAQTVKVGTTGFGISHSF